MRALGTGWLASVVTGLLFQAGTTVPICVVRGSVVDAATSAPVPGVTVTVSLAVARTTIEGDTVHIRADSATAARLGLNGPTSVVTGPDGTFAFNVPVTGQLTFTAERQGYARAGYGQMAWDAQRRIFTPPAGASKCDVTLRIWKLGAVRGRVIDEQGDPAVDVTVHALRRVHLGGETRFVSAGMSRTDDTGRYNLTNLQPGSYLIALPSSVITIPLAIADQYRQATGAPTAQFGRVDVNSGSPLPSATGPDLTVRRMDVEWHGPIGNVLRTAAGDTSRLEVYPATFYPSVTSPSEATVLDLTTGSEISDASIHIQPVPSVSVSGSLAAPDGPASFIGLRVVPEYAETFASDRGFEAALTASDATGRFTLLGVPAGRYVLKALTGSNAWTPPLGTPEALLTLTVDAQGRLSAPTRASTAPLQWIQTPLDVGDQNVTDLALKLSAGIRLAGQVVFDGTAPRPSSPRQMSMLLSPVDHKQEGAGSPAWPDTDWRFVLAPATPGRYELAIPRPDEHWNIKSVTVGGRDILGGSVVLDSDPGDVVVTMTDRVPPAIVGTARFIASSTNGDLPPQVIAFPADVESWIASGMNDRRLRSGVAGVDGGFALTNVIPGEYCVIALTADTRVDLTDPAFIRAAAARAKRVAVAFGARESLSLEAVTVRW